MTARGIIQHLLYTYNLYNHASFFVKSTLHSVLIKHHKLTLEREGWLPTFAITDCACAGANGPVDIYVLWMYVIFTGNLSGQLCYGHACVFSLTFWKARPAQMIFITTNNNCSVWIVCVMSVVYTPCNGTNDTSYHIPLSASEYNYTSGLSYYRY